MTVKRRARRALDVAGRAIGTAQVWWFRRRRPGPVTVLDIDNTLADSWPSFLREWPSDRARLRALHMLPGVKAAAYDSAGGPVLFLSHRNWWDWPLTRSWLRRNGMRGVLVVVATPGDKVAHLRRLAAGGPVVLWDDCSHGTEHGTTQRYDAVIDAARELGIEHHGLDEIEAIVAAAGGRRGPDPPPPSFRV